MRKMYLDPEYRAMWSRRAKAYRRDDPRRDMLGQAKKRARMRGVPFNLKLEDLIIPELCPVLGLKLAIHDGHGMDASPSLDAIIPSLGYVPGNIQVISNLANRMKNSATLQQLLVFARWVISEYTEPTNEQHRQLKAVA